ncbi:transcription factor MYB119-like [Silene latifolia]|uniref:transcription factor MYB119-like n=1 Tax=Silene latifolia TaxID=37657 RepID=UPI003D7713C0
MALENFSVTTTRRKGGRGHKMKPDVVKGQWTIEEDRLLIQLVERYGIRKWSQIAQLLNGRIGKQCRERWHNHLRPDIKKDIWSEAEDMILIKAHAEIGNKWAEIAKNLPGRTENSIKNHWNATKRRQLSKRKCRSKYPRQSSILQDYINGLSPEIINAGCRKKQPTNNNKINNNNTTNNGDNTRKSSNDQIGSSDSSSSNLFADEFDFGDEVPDFNFDDHMFEESSIESLLDYVPNEEPGNTTICHDDHFQEKQELDLVEMINQANF